MMFKFVLTLVVALTAGCGDLPYFKCLEDSQCVDYDLNRGRCLTAPTGPYCAFPAKDCATGWRWDRLARGDLSEQCVAPSISLDAAVDAAVDMSPPHE